MHPCLYPAFPPLCSARVHHGRPASRPTEAGMRSPLPPASSQTVRRGVRGERGCQPLGDRERRGGESEAFSGLLRLSARFSGERTPRRAQSQPLAYTRKSHVTLHIYNHPCSRSHRNLFHPICSANSVIQRTASPDRTRTCAPPVYGHLPGLVAPRISSPRPPPALRRTGRGRTTHLTSQPCDRRRGRKRSQPTRSHRASGGSPDRKLSVLQAFRSPASTSAEVKTSVLAPSRGPVNSSV